MYQGFQVSNILEQSVCSNSTLYSPHYSLFDIAISECDLDLYAFDPHVKDVFVKSTNIVSVPEGDISWRSYGAYVSNTPMQNLKQNLGASLHLNSLWIVHDLNFLNLKKEDGYLICSTAFRPADQMIYFLNNMKHYHCPKINQKQMTYAIPDTISRIESSRSKNMGVFCYNKTINENIKNILGCDATILSKIPQSSTDIAKELSEYKILIEFDPFSIYNILCGIMCGCVGIVLDPNGFLVDTYKNIPNLFIVQSLDELKQVIASDLTYIESHDVLNNFRNFDQFKLQLQQTLNDMQRKAFLI